MSAHLKSKGSSPRSAPEKTTKGSRTAKRGTRSRTFTGCGTCRSRHLKCDEARPICSTCRRLNRPCQGYAPRFQWVAEYSSEKNPKEKPELSGGSFRFPLYTEDARNDMSMELVESLGHQSAGVAVLDLDAGFVADGQSRFVGPFGVLGPSFLRLRTTTSEYGLMGGGSPRTTAGDDPDITRPGSAPVFSSRFIDSNSSHKPIDYWVDTPMQQALDVAFLPGGSSNGVSSAMFTAASAETEQWLHPDLQLETEKMLVRLPDNDLTNFVVTPPESPQIGGDLYKTQHLPAGVDHNSNLWSDIIPHHDTADVPFPERTLISDTPSLPAHARRLLRHLKNDVFEGQSASLHRKSPWNLLLLPCAVEAFAELSLWHGTSNTRRSILSTLLAKSAHNLQECSMHDSQEASFWMEVASNHQRDAQLSLALALRTEVEGEHEAKYTETLMAMLGVGVISIIFHGSSPLKQLLPDAERLIRLRGLAANKTPDIRVLHHMYTHLRLLMESTNVFPSNSSESNDSGQENDDTTFTPGRFGLQNKSLVDLERTGTKTDAVGYNDIHLDISGDWKGTLYPEIYCIPESLMTLLSQTISLVNDKPKLEAQAVGDPTIASALSQHIKILERQVWSWPSQVTRSSAEATNADQPAVKSLGLAMHQALLIYFYRRVHNVSAMIIQDQVQKTLDYIDPCLKILTPADQDFAMSICWTVFIAACEAVIPDIQSRAVEMLKMMDHAGIFLEDSEPSSIVRAIYKQREQSGDLTFSWPGFLIMRAR